jgi:hypothetical protein
MEATLKRILLAVALAIATIAPLAPAPVVAAPTAVVTWTVDHKHKTITVSVRLAIFVSSCTPSKSADCSATDAKIAADIRTDIESVWNPKAGSYHYKCYKLIVQVDVAVVGDRFAVPGNSHGILIDRSGEGARSETTNTLVSGVVSKFTDNYLSNDPADRLEPSNNLAFPSEWSYPRIAAHSYAHEFGHVIGLDDYYEEGTFNARPGAPTDIMTDSNRATITQETINRAVERSRDRLVDTSGKPVELKDLVCDLTFKATFKSDDVHYDATRLTDSGCHTPEFTNSTDQTLRVDSQPEELRVVEAPGVGPGYVLTPTLDLQALQNGITTGGRSNAAVGLFDLGITVGVTRFHNDPATGDLPPVLDIASTFCPGGDGGHTPPPKDCGARTYKSWLAIQQSGANELWPVASSMPALFKGLGRDSGRLDLLYRNCPGPTPWPGAFAENGGAQQMTKGKLPTLDVISKVAKDWYYDKVSGRLEITGSASVDTVAPGDLENSEFSWTLTLCPENADGETPPDCP